MPQPGSTSTFLHIHRLFLGPGLPPSNAVLPHLVAGVPPLPAHHHRARRGLPLSYPSPTFLEFLPSVYRGPRLC